MYIPSYAKARPNPIMNKEIFARKKKNKKMDIPTLKEDHGKQTGTKQRKVRQAYQKTWNSAQT